MDTEQLFARGKEIFPETNYERDGGPEKILKILEWIGQTRQRLEELADITENRLLKKEDMAEWAKQREKPSYTAGEVGADAVGSAREALAAAVEYSDAAYRQAAGYADLLVAALVNGAPDTLNTLKKIADEMAENEDVVTALQSAIGNKANDVELQAHMSNGTVHITAGERNAWNAVITKYDLLAASFRDGCNTLVNGCINHGVTPVSNSPADIMLAVGSIADGRYSAGVLAARKGTAKAAQVLAGYTFTNSSAVAVTGTMANRGAVAKTLNAGQSYTVPEGYHNGKGKVTAAALAGQTGGTAAAGNLTKGKTAWVNGTKITGTGADNTAQYNAGVAAADGRANTNSVNYKTGYNAGVAAADARANPASANYKSGYNAGVAAARLKETALPLSLLSGNGGTTVTSGDINFAGALFLRINYGYTSANREACVAKVYRGTTVYRQQYIPKGYSAGSALAAAGLTAIIDVSGIGGVANFQLYPDNGSSGRNDAGTYAIQSMLLYSM